VRAGRNSRTGAHVAVDQKGVPSFKTGKEMRDRPDNDPCSQIEATGCKGDITEFE